MLSALLGTSWIQEELQSLILDKTEGVSFFLEELVKSLQETGAIERLGMQWHLKAGATVHQVPDTVEELLMARIDRLPEAAQHLLQLGAVIGQELSWE